MDIQHSNGEGRVQIPCLDNFGFRYAARLRLVPEHGEHGCVVLMLRLGETAWLCPDEAQMLAEQLTLAARQVEAQAAELRRAVEASNARAAADVVALHVKRGV